MPADKPARRATALLLGMLLLSPGCTTQTQRLGADDGTDSCRPQLVALDSTGDFFAQDIVAGAAIGAAGGALLGGLAGGNARSALYGALGGAAVGAAAGYWKARTDQIQDQQALYRTVSADIARDNAQIDRTQLAFDQLATCRRGQAEAIRDAHRSGRLPRAQAEAAMAALRQRSARDLQLAQAIDTKIRDRGDGFAFANEQVNPGAPVPGPAPAAAPARAPARAQPRPAPRPAAPATPAGAVQEATSTNLAKREQFTQSIATAQAAQSGFELAS